LKETSKLVRFPSCENDDGIEPEKLLCAKSRDVRPVAFPNESGMVPEKKFPLTFRDCKLRMFPREEGSEPDILFAEMFKNMRDDALLSPSGTLPDSALLLKSMYCSCVAATHDVEGRVPFSLLLFRLRRRSLEARLTLSGTGPSSWL